MTLDAPTIERTDDRYRMVFDEVYATDADDLWAAITQPERLERWLSGYTGDLRLGGTWATAVPYGEEPWCRGTVTACDPPRSFTTGWHAIGEEPTEVTVRLEPVDGGTRMVLEHEGVQSLMYGAGWQTYLEQLGRHLDDPSFTHDEDAWNLRYSALQPAYDNRFAAL